MTGEWRQRSPPEGTVLAAKSASSVIPGLKFSKSAQPSSRGRQPFLRQPRSQTGTRVSSWPVVQVWDGQIKGSREAEQQPGLPHGSLMRETVRAVGGDGLAGLRCNGDAGPAIDGSRVADESDRAAAGVKNVPVLANDVIGHGDRAGSRDVHPRVRRFQDVGRGLGRKERCYGVVAAVKMDGLATVNEVGTYKAIVRARAGSIGGAVDCGRRTVGMWFPAMEYPLTCWSSTPMLPTPLQLM